MVQSPRTRVIALAALGVETRTRGSHRLSSKRDAPRMLLSSQLRRLEVYPHAESRATSTMFSICALLFTRFAYHECMCVSVGSGRGGAPGALACMSGGAPPKYHVAKATMWCFNVGPPWFCHQQERG